MGSVRSILGACVLTLAMLAASAHGDAGRLAAQGGTSSGTGPIQHVSAEDRAMNAAIARARATLPEFLPRLQNPPPGQSYLGVKVRLGGQDRGEHIWLYDVRWENGQIVGKLVDDAVYYPRWRRDAVFRVAPERISDWMTVQNGRVCGGFTSRLMVARLSAEQRARWLRSMQVERFPAGDAVCDEGPRP